MKEDYSRLMYVVKQLDEFAKEKRVNKSALLEVALLDLFERYN